MNSGSHDCEPTRECSCISNRHNEWFDCYGYIRTFDDVNWKLGGKGGNPVVAGLGNADDQCYPRVRSPLPCKFGWPKNRDLPDFPCGT